MDVADPGGGDRLGWVDLLVDEARLVLVEVLAGEAGLLVVGPDERLAAVDVVERVRPRDVVADRLEVGALRDWWKVISSQIPQSATESRSSECQSTASVTAR